MSFLAAKISTSIHWKDQYGKVGNRIDAYYPAGEHYDVFQGFRFFLAFHIGVLGVKDKNPIVIGIRASPELQDGKVVCSISQYPDWKRKRINEDLELTYY